MIYFFYYLLFLLCQLLIVLIIILKLKHFLCQLFKVYIFQWVMVIVWFFIIFCYLKSLRTVSLVVTNRAQVTDGL